jgi:hypothetical protein
VGGRLWFALFLSKERPMNWLLLLTPLLSIVTKIGGVGTGRSEIPALKIEPIVQSLEMVQTTVCMKK